MTELGLWTSVWTKPMFLWPRCSFSSCHRERPSPSPLLIWDVLPLEHLNSDGESNRCPWVATRNPYRSLQRPLLSPVQFYSSPNITVCTMLHHLTFDPQSGWKIGGKLREKERKRVPPPGTRRMWMELIECDGTTVSCRYEVSGIRTSVIHWCTEPWRNGRTWSEVWVHFLLP